MKERLSSRGCVVGGSGGFVSSAIMITMQGGPQITQHPFPSVCLRLLSYCIVSTVSTPNPPLHHNLLTGLPLSLMFSTPLRVRPIIFYSIREASIPSIVVSCLSCQWCPVFVCYPRPWPGAAQVTRLGSVWPAWIPRGGKPLLDWWRSAARYFCPLHTSLSLSVRLSWAELTVWPQTAISYQHHHQHHQHYAVQSHNQNTSGSIKIYLYI